MDVFKRQHSMATAVTGGSPLSIWYQTACVGAVVEGGRFEMLVVGVMCEVGGEVVVACGPYCSNVTDASVTALATHCPSLASLSLNTCRNVTEQQKDSMTRTLPNLRIYD